MSQARKQRYRESAPPPQPRATAHGADLRPGLNVIDGIPVLRVDRAAFDAMKGRSVMIAADLDAEDEAEVIA